MTITRDRLTSLLGSLRYQATHDELTALGNRTLFTDKIAEALAEQGPGVAVVVADLDHFRDVNDSFGHAMGDRLLRAVGVRFHRACGRQNVVARLGSDEFGILLPAGGGEPAALDVVERLRAGAAAAHRRRRAAAPGARDVRRGGRGRGPPGRRASWSGTRTSPSPRRATPHPGRVTTARPPPASPSSNRRCTSARGTARSCPRSSSGRSTGASCSSSTSRSSTSRRRPCTASRRSPAGTTPPAAWCRRRCSCRSPRPPGRSCPSGGGCCARRRGSWPAGAREFPDGYPLTMEVNLSTGQLADPGLVPSVVALVEETGVDPRDLTLEITESALVEDLDAALRPLRQLAAVGVRLALDDFGTGYSVADLPAPAPRARCSRSTGRSSSTATPAARARACSCAGSRASARAWGCRSSPRASRRSGRRERVREAGCHLGQGFLWARPMPACDVTEILRRGGPLTPLPERLRAAQGSLRDHGQAMIPLQLP